MRSTPDSPSPCHGKIVMISASMLDTNGRQVYSPLWPTQGNLQLATRHASLLFPGWGIWNHPPLTLPSAHQPQHTDTISIVKFTLKPFKLLDKESLTHTHHRIQSQEITGLQKKRIIPLLVVSSTLFLYNFWIFSRFRQRLCWICFLLRKELKTLVRARFKIVPTSNQFSHPLNSTGLRDR